MCEEMGVVKGHEQRNSLHMSEATTKLGSPIDKGLLTQGAFQAAYLLRQEKL